jgi:hypothetical protein
MQHFRRSRLTRTMVYLVMAALVAPYVALAAPSSSLPTKSVTTVAVIPMQDATGTGNVVITREATSAVALSMEDTREYMVTSTADLEREMASLVIQVPLSKAEQVHLGQRLKVDKVLTGRVTAMSVDARTGRARVGFSLMMLDVGIGEYLDGAVMTITSKSIPGWNGDVNLVIAQATREAADAAVAQMLASRVKRGNIDLVDDLGNININMGTDNGIVSGTEFLVMRPVWAPDIEEVIMRHVGIIRVGSPDEIAAQLSVAHTISGATPATGDKIYRIYKPEAVTKQEVRSASIKRTGQLIAALALLAGLFAVGGGETTTSASDISGALAQAGPGTSPEFVQLSLHTGGTGVDKMHGFMIFRNVIPSFAWNVFDLIDIIPASNQPYVPYSDGPAARVAVDGEVQFQFIDQNQGGTGGGSQTEGSVTATFDVAGLTPGTSYYYMCVRITDPIGRPGANPPIGTAQVGQITATPDFSIFSDASNTFGPITYFHCPTLILPADNAVSQPPTSVTFNWQTMVGADQYRVEVFQQTDPNGTGTPYQVSSVVSKTSGTASVTLPGPFSDTTQNYFWRVGGRKSLEPGPLSQTVHKTGWLYSAMRHFTPALSPPPLPTSVHLAPATPPQVGRPSGQARPFGHFRMPGHWPGPAGRGSK